ncbi:MAG: CHC2 zinc finger domain-containing protein [Actinomycetota bacterium]
MRSHGYQITKRRTTHCPFHADEHPSLSFYRARDGRERWHCFPCDLDGDALDLEAMLTKRSVQQVIRDRH